MAAKPGTHPSANALFAFATCTLDDVTAAGIMKHVDDCPDCCRVITALVGDDFLVRFRQEQSAISTPAPVESPAGVALAPTPAETSRVKITCPSCAVTDSVPASFSGKEVGCRKCRAKFTVDSQKTVLRKSEPTQVAKPDHAEDPPHVDDTDRVSDGGRVLAADGASVMDRVAVADGVWDTDPTSDADHVSDAAGTSDTDRVSDADRAAERSSGKRTGQRTGKRTGKQARLPVSDRRQLFRWLVVGSCAATVLIGVGLVIILRGSGPSSEAKAELEAKLPPPSIPDAGAKDQTKQPGKVIDTGAEPVKQPDEKSDPPPIDKGAAPVKQPDEKPGVPPPVDKGGAPVTKPDDELALPPPPVPLTEDAIYSKAVRSTVYIIGKVKVDGKEGVSWGSGSLVNRTSKVVVTNVHVIEGVNDIRVYFPEKDMDGKLITQNSHYRRQFPNGKGLRVTVLATDRGRDLALVRLDGDLPADAQAIPLATKPLVPGQRILSIGGNPKGSEGQWVSTTGTIRQVYQKQWKAGVGDLDAKVVEVQSPTNHGDSGGPVVNDRAEQIAVTQGGMKSQYANLMNFAIHIDEAKNLLKLHGIEWLEPNPTAGAVLDLPLFRRALKSKNLKNCRKAAERLLEFGPEAEPLTDELIEALRHPDALVRQYAARALGEIGEAASRAVPELVNLLDDVEVQGAALGALDKMGPAVVDAVPKVVKLLDAGKKDVRDGAANILIHLGPQAKQELGKLGAKAAKAIPALAKLLKENKEKEGLVRLAAASALEAIGREDSQTAVPALTHALRDPVPAVRAQAATALGAMGPKAEPAVLELGRVLILQNSDLPTRRACAGALAGIGPGSVKAMGALAAAAYDGDPVTRANTLDALIQIGPKAEEAVPALLSCLRDRNRFDAKTYAKLFAKAALALGKIGEPARKQIVSLNILKSSTDWWEVTGAVMAIKNAELSKAAAHFWAKHMEAYVVGRMARAAKHELDLAFAIASKAAKADKEAARAIETARAIQEAHAIEVRDLRRWVIEAVDNLKSR